MAAAAACGGSQPAEPAAPPAPPAPPAAGPGGEAAGAPTALPPEAQMGGPAAQIDWAAMNETDRQEHMKNVVAPRMAAVFQSFNAEAYADADCTLCHGQRALDGEFDMPNPDLPQLTKSNGIEDELQANPEVGQFMLNKVVPEMAAAVGVPPYDPATGQGLGCFVCHTSSD